MNKKALLILGLIVIVGISLRLYDLSKESFWADETFTLRYAQSSSFPELWQNIETTEGAPFGHYLLLQYWIQLFGNSEFSVRFPSVIFGILSIWIMYLLGKKVAGENVGLLSALLLSTSMLQVLFSQEARLYSFYGFLALLSTYLIVLIGDKEEGKNCSLWYYVSYGFIMVTCAYTNYLTLFLLMFHFLFFSWRGFTRTKYPLLYTRFTITLFLTIPFCLPLLPLVMTQFSVGSYGLIDALIKKGLPPFLASLGMFFYVLPLILFFAILEIVIYNKEKITPKLEKLFSPTFFLSSIIIFSTIYLYLVFKPLNLWGIPIIRFPITHSYFLIRHSYFLVPILYLVFSYGLTSLKSRKIALLCLGILLFTNVIALHEYYAHPTKVQWREASHYIQLFGNQPLLVDSGGPATDFSLQYYAPAFYDTTRLTWIEGRRDVQSLSEKELLLKLQNKKQFWLALTPAQKKGDYYRDLLNQHYHLDFQRSFYQLNLYHYSNPALKNGQ